MAAATAAAMAAASWIERGSPWAGLNAMATAVGAGGRRARDGFEPGVTPAGLAALTAGLLGWGVIYEAALAATGWRRSPVTGALSGLGAYAVDRLLLPRWVVPNFRRKMGAAGVAAKYTALALASASPR
jgi:hypothetical protein